MPLSSLKRVFSRFHEETTMLHKAYVAVPMKQRRHMPHKPGLNTSPTFVVFWKFLLDMVSSRDYMYIRGIDGLENKPKSGRPSKLPEEVAVKIRKKLKEAGT
jgi:hypothetical protein